MAQDDIALPEWGAERSSGVERSGGGDRGAGWDLWGAEDGGRGRRRTEKGGSA